MTGYHTTEPQKFTEAQSHIFIDPSVILREFCVICGVKFYTRGRVRRSYTAMRISLNCCS